MPFDPNLYQEKYRIPSSRAEWWDYYEGMYFVTIVVKNRGHAFGEIVQNCESGRNQIIHSPLGKFVDDEIPQIMDHYPYVYIPTWIVMPDHVHLFVMIDIRGRTWDDRDCIHNHDNRGGVSITVTADERTQNAFMASIAPKRGSLGLVIGRFKGAVTKYAHENHIPFAWQERFHERIIKNQIGFDSVQNYIENNVQNWGK